MIEPDEPTGDAFDSDLAFPEQDEPEVREKRQVTARGVAILGARTVAGLVGVGVAVVAITASALLPLPTLDSVAPAQLITPVPTAQQLVCAGAVLRLADASGADATTSFAIDRPTVRYGSSSGTSDSTPVETSDADTGATSAAPAIVSTPPVDAGSTDRVLLSGAQVQQVAEGDLVGLAASDCSDASGDVWLAGGATTVGRTTLLSLTNPSEVPATVNVELFGETGKIAAPGTTGIIVPANGQRVLSLAGFEPGVVSPVVHLTSVGGQVAAILQQSIVRGLTPGGVDTVGPVGPLSTDIVIPGMVVTDIAEVQALRAGGEPYDDVATVLRFFAPGEGQASLTVSVVPEDGTAGTSFALDVDAGRVVDIPVDDLGTGNYTVRITSSVPAVAAARVTSAAGASTDFAWFASAPELVGLAQVTVAPGPAPLLHLANTSAAPVTVALAGPDGANTSVTVPAEAAVLLPIAAGTWGLSQFTSVYAAVTVAADGMIAHYSVHPPAAGSTPVTVYP